MTDSRHKFDKLFTLDVNSYLTGLTCYAQPDSKHRKGIRPARFLKVFEAVLFPGSSDGLRTSLPSAYPVKVFETALLPNSINLQGTSPPSAYPVKVFETALLPNSINLQGTSTPLAHVADVYMSRTVVQ